MGIGDVDKLLDFIHLYIYTYYMEQPIHNETFSEKDNLMAKMFRTIGMPDLAELYEPRPCRFVADKIHRLNIPVEELTNQAYKDDR